MAIRTVTRYTEARIRRRRAATALDLIEEEVGRRVTAELDIDRMLALGIDPRF